MNEIFKGMDNAAEQINQNFEELKPQFGSNENGNWERLPSGKVMCTATSNVLQGNSFTWEYPVEFTKIPVVVALPTTNIDVWQSAKSLTSITIGKSGAGYLNLIAIGEVEEATE